MSKQETVQYQPETIALRWPIKDDKGADVTELTLNLVNRGDHADVMAKDPDDREAFAAFASLSCGLTESEVKRLKAPDWNKLRLKLSDLVSKSSDHFFKELGVKLEKDSPVLLCAIDGDDGSKITKVDLEVPSVATTDLMQKQETPEARTLFITMSCTGLSKAELDQLSCPDWNYLQGRLSDFLNESADFFQ